MSTLTGNSPKRHSYPQLLEILPDLRGQDHRFDIEFVARVLGVGAQGVGRGPEPLLDGFDVLELG